MNCSECLNARSVISENGMHSVCCLKEEDMRDCLFNRGVNFIKNPMKKSKESVPDTKSDK